MAEPASSAQEPAPAPAKPLAIAAALLSLYLVWGSTYLAMAIAIRSMPPLLMAGLRFATAGTILLLVLRIAGRFAVAPTPWPTWRQWLGALAVGALLLLGGNGTVSLVLHAVPSGIAALVLASTTLAVVLVGWLCGGPRPSPRLAASILLGLGGVGILVWHPVQPGETAPWPVWGIAVLLLAALSWAGGSVLSRRLGGAWHIASPWLATGAQMLCGGVLLLLAAAVHGEWSAVDPQAITGESLAAWAYLVLVGAMVGYGSYIWLLRHASPALATSYGYVNPLVAIALGAWLNHEPVTGQTLLAAAVILVSVALIATAPRLSPVEGALSLRAGSPPGSGRSGPARGG